MKWDQLGELLIARQWIERRQWQAVVTEHERWGSNLLRLLLDKKAVEENALVHALSELYKLQAVNLDEGQIADDIIDLVPVEDAEKHELIPFRRHGNFLDVAIGDPSNMDGVDRVRVQTALNVRAYIAGLHSLHRAIARYYGRVIVGGYAVDPRVTSGMFLRGDLVEFESARAAKVKAAPVEPPPEAAPASAAPAAPAAPALEARIAELEARLADHVRRSRIVEALLKRDEDVLRRLCGLLIDKGVTTRDELAELLR